MGFMTHCQSARLVCGRSWVRIRGWVIPITLKVPHTAFFPASLAKYSPEGPEINKS